MYFGLAGFPDKLRQSSTNHQYPDTSSTSQTWFSQWTVLLPYLTRCHPAAHSVISLRNEFLAPSAKSFPAQSIQVGIGQQSGHHLSALLRHSASPVATGGQQMILQLVIVILAILLLSLHIAGVSLSSDAMLAVLAIATLGEFSAR